MKYFMINLLAILFIWSCGKVKTFSGKADHIQQGEKKTNDHTTQNMNESEDQHQDEASETGLLQLSHPKSVQVIDGPCCDDKGGASKHSEPIGAQDYLFIVGAKDNTKASQLNYDNFDHENVIAVKLNLNGMASISLKPGSYYLIDAPTLKSWLRSTAVDASMLKIKNLPDEAYNTKLSAPNLSFSVKQQQTVELSLDALTIELE